MPEDNSKTRRPRIPSVADHVHLTIHRQASSLVYELRFPKDSYGLRPNLSARQALQRNRETVNDSYGYRMSLSLERFLDTANRGN